MISDKNDQAGLEQWLDLIRRQDMPIFDQTVQRVMEVSGDDQAPMSDLAGAILQDASMTARVLKLANSIAYNPGSTPISTVTRAVIVLGSNAVRNICLTLTLVDTLVKGAAKARLGRELGRAMHAAVQARALASARGDRSPEEVFIATLLYRIGELAFWCFGGEHADRIDQLTSRQGLAPEQAQERVLGFRLSQLTRQLAREWHLTELLQEAIHHPARRDPRVQTVMLGQQIARSAEAHGWSSDEMDRLMKKGAALTGLQTGEIKDLVLQKAGAAKQIAADYGAMFAAPHIPQPRTIDIEPDQDAAPAETQASQAPDERFPARNSKLQSKILRELGTVLETASCNFNVIMELVLEGIFRGVGVDRVVFALTTPDKRGLRAKYALGEDSAKLAEAFRFDRPDRGEDVLFQTMDNRRPYCLAARTKEDLQRTVPHDLARLTGAAPFMVAPIVIDSQSIGLFYADRGPSSRALDPACFEEFKHFVQQANLGLTQASARRRP